MCFHLNTAALDIRFVSDRTGQKIKHDFSVISRTFRRGRKGLFSEIPVIALLMLFFKRTDKSIETDSSRTRFDILEDPSGITVHRQAKFAQSTILCFQYLGFHDHTFNSAKLANYVICPGFPKQITNS